MANRGAVFAFQTLFLAWAIFGCLARVRAAGDDATQGDDLATALTGGESSVRPSRRQLSEPVQREALGIIPGFPTNSNSSNQCLLPCLSGLTCCSGLLTGICFDLNNDLLHCGNCTTICPLGSICCKGTCANLLFDSNNCGYCGHKCGSGLKCHLGFCNYGQ